jgi:hypothetical protein
MAYMQVKRLGAEDSTERTTDQTEIGIYWGYDVARGLGDPPRLYNQIARVIAAQEGNTVGQNARMFALINLAMADAGIQCWGVKYRDILWRPIVAIRDGDIDGNPDTVGDPNWQPLGAPRSNPLPSETENFTPPFPSYTSGHATFGGAAFKTMADFYQTNDISFSIPFDFISDEFNGVTRDIHDAIPDIILNHVRDMLPRHFNSFSQAAAENAASRIFLGIHYRFDAIQGVSAGDRIADYTFDHLLRARAGRQLYHVPTVDFVRQLDAYLDGSYTTYFARQGSPPIKDLSASTGHGTTATGSPAGAAAAWATAFGQVVVASGSPGPRMGVLPTPAAGRVSLALTSTSGEGTTPARRVEFLPAVGRLRPRVASPAAEPFVLMTHAPVGEVVSTLLHARSGPA